MRKEKRRERHEAPEGQRTPGMKGYASREFEYPESDMGHGQFANMPQDKKMWFAKECEYAIRDGMYKGDSIEGLDERADKNYRSVKGQISWDEY